MSRVIIFSRYFPATHPRKGDQTFFREKIWSGLADKLYPDFKIPDHCTDWDWHEYYNAKPKWHTIRLGRRWKVGDKFSPRVWSDRPYASKQIIIAPDIELKKVWDVHIEFIGSNIHVMIPKESRTDEYFLISAGDVAKNDGLDVYDFIEWFKRPKRKDKFIGQILCWNENINYLTLGT